MRNKRKCDHFFYYKWKEREVLVLKCDAMFDFKHLIIILFDYISFRSLGIKIQQNLHFILGVYFL